MVKSSGLLRTRLRLFLETNTVAANVSWFLNCLLISHLTSSKKSSEETRLVLLIIVRYLLLVLQLTEDNRRLACHVYYFTFIPNLKRYCGVAQLLREVLQVLVLSYLSGDENNYVHIQVTYSKLFY